MGINREVDMMERLSELIIDINASQESEKEILRIMQNNGDISTYDVDVYLSQIKTYTTERQESMKKMFKLMKEVDAVVYIEFDSQVQLIILREKQMEDVKKTLKVLNDNKRDSEKQSQITTYYSKYYHAWSEYMGMFFLIFVCNVLVFYLSYISFLPSIIPVFILASSVVYLYIISVDLRHRDTRVFDEYNWKFDPNEVKVDEYNSDLTSLKGGEPVTAVSAEKCSADVAASIAESGGTIQCAEGKIYDDKLFKCVIKPESDGDVEGFSNYMDCKTVHME